MSFEVKYFCVLGHVFSPPVVFLFPAFDEYNNIKHNTAHCLLQKEPGPNFSPKTGVALFYIVFVSTVFCFYFKLFPYLCSQWGRRADGKV